MKKTFLALAAALALTGCTSVAPGAASVRVANDPKDVAGCRVVATWGALLGLRLKD